MRTRILLQVALTILTSVIIGNGAVSASSIYDDNYQTTSTLETWSNNNDGYDGACAATNLTNTWSDYITDSSKWFNPSDALNPSSPMSLTRASFLEAMNDPNGSWGVTQHASEHMKSVIVFWSSSGVASLDWSMYAHIGAVVYTNANYVEIRCKQYEYGWGGSTPVALYRNYTHSSNPVVSIESSYPSQYKNLFVYNANNNYPTGYAGEEVPSSSEWADLDGDGLIAAQEAAQSTSNTNRDTDGDGLSDFTESQWYPERENIFCGASQCAYPNPTEKDVYVEIDWMKDSSNRTFKPTATQLGLVEDMFADKNINFHADVGQFGGGNELATYTHDLRQAATPGQVDYWDYVSGGDGVTANFSSDRNSIWRYMIYGYKYFGSTSTGWAEAMGDNLFISGGLIEDMSGLVSMDRAIANTMAHEIGHNLCLSDEQIFVEQPAECVYEGIDNDDNNNSYYNLEDYESVMNYRYQLTDQDDMGVVDYSDGSNGADDHDDWGAVMIGMGGFSGTKTYLGAERIAKQHIITPDGDVIIEETPIEEMGDASMGTASVPNSNGDDRGGFAKKSFQPENGKTETESASSESESQEWTPWALSGGVAAIILGIVWYIRSR